MYSRYIILSTKSPLESAVHAVNKTNKISADCTTDLAWVVSNISHHPEIICSPHNKSLPSLADITSLHADFRDRIERLLEASRINILSNHVQLQLTVQTPVTYILTKDTTSDWVTLKIISS